MTFFSRLCTLNIELLAGLEFLYKFLIRTSTFMTPCHRPGYADKLNSQFFFEYGILHSTGHQPSGFIANDPKAFSFEVIKSHKHIQN